MPAKKRKPAKSAKKKNPPHRPPHRPPHQPTPETRAAVQALAALGTTQSQICEYLGKFMRLPLASENSLRKHYATELGLAKTHQTLMVSQGLYRKAVGAPATYNEKGEKVRDEVKPEVTAQIFWLKAQANWSEPSRWGNTAGQSGDSGGMSLEELIHASYQAGAAKKAPPPSNGGEPAP